MTDFTGKLWTITTFHIEKVASLDLQLVYFEKKETALYIATALIVIAVVRIMLPKSEKYRTHSGIDGIKGEGLIAHILLYTARAFFVFGTVGILLAIAKPYTTHTAKETLFQARERVDLIDVSASMIEIFDPIEKVSKAEEARLAFLEFLELRRQYNVENHTYDRSSLWVFSSNPYKIQDFIIDDETYMFQAYMAPYAYISRPNVLPRTYYKTGEGSTNLKRALDSIIAYFDEHGSSSSSKKALLIITDAITYENILPQLRELRRRKIVPYVLFIQGKNNQPPSWLYSLSSFGGTFFKASSPQELQRAFMAINTLELAPAPVKQYEVRSPLFYIPLFLGSAFLVVSLILGIVYELFWGTHP